MVVNDPMIHHLSIFKKKCLIVSPTALGDIDTINKDDGSSQTPLTPGKATATCSNNKGTRRGIKGWYGFIVQQNKGLVWFHCSAE